MKIKELIEKLRLECAENAAVYFDDPWDKPFVPIGDATPLAKECAVLLSRGDTPIQRIELIGKLKQLARQSEKSAQSDVFFKHQKNVTELFPVKSVHRVREREFPKDITPHLAVQLSEEENNN